MPRFYDALKKRLILLFHAIKWLLGGIITAGVIIHEWESAVARLDEWGVIALIAGLFAILVAIALLFSEISVMGILYLCLLVVLFGCFLYVFFYWPREQSLDEFKKDVHEVLSAPGGEDDT